jgi:hypothetical protein
MATSEPLIFEEASTSLRCLDRVALSELNKSTCCFYPTHVGIFLSWQRGLGRRIASRCFQLSR